MKPIVNLTNEMCAAARATSAGKLLDRLITEELARGGNTNSGIGGSILQQLWEAMAKASGKIRTTKPQLHVSEKRYRKSGPQPSQPAPGNS
jgi:hypothetical protein